MHPGFRYARERQPPAAGPNFRPGARLHPGQVDDLRGYRPWLNAGKAASGSLYKEFQKAVTINVRTEAHVSARESHRADRSWRRYGNGRSVGID
jgi:hypothetical protein